MLATEGTPRTPSTERCSPKQSKARPSRVTYPRRRFRRIASGGTRRPACSLITVARVRASSPSSSPSHSHHAHRLSFPSEYTQSVVALDHHLPTIRLVGNSVTSRRPRARTHAHHAAGGVGAAAASAGGEAVGAGDGPVRWRVSVGEGAGDRAEAGGDARDAARPPRVRVRALPHRPRREDRDRRWQQRRRGPSAAAATATAAEREEGGEPAEPAGQAGRAVRVRQAGRAAAGGGIEEGLLEAARGQRERGREEQLPQQQRWRAAQLLHAPLLHPQLHRAAPQRLRPRALRLQRRRHRRPRGLQQEGERRGHRQVLADAVGPAVAQVQPAGAGRRVRGDPTELCSRRREGLKTLSDAAEGKDSFTYLRFCTYFIRHTVVVRFLLLLVRVQKRFSSSMNELFIL